MINLTDRMPGWPAYVSATHRSPEGSGVRFRPRKGSHRMRIKLASTGSGQEAAIILAYPDLHIAPWTKDEPCTPNCP